MNPDSSPSLLSLLRNLQTQLMWAMMNMFGEVHVEMSDDNMNESAALCLSVQVWVANLEHPRVNTCSLYASPTGLSPYLRFGCLSCRVLYYNLRELYMKVLWISVSASSAL